MTTSDLELLKEISETAGVPGDEERMRHLLYGYLYKLDGEISTDNLGNLIFYKKSKKKDAKRLLVTAHIDEIGFIITHIDDNGFLRFHTLGGFDPKTLTSQRVIVHGKKDLVGVMGSKPVHVMSPEEKNKAPKTTDFFIDLGMSADEVRELVSVGDSVSRERSLIEMGNCLNGKSLDNRISVYILLKALQNLNDKLSSDLYAVFTVQEEVGLRGAQVIAHQVNPDFALALDTTIAYDVPGASPQENITKLGDGPAIKIMDSGVICDKRMIRFLEHCAEKSKIDCQKEILTAGGTDTAYLQRMGKNSAIAGAISVPTRHIHQVIETVNKKDVEESIELLLCAVEEVGLYNWPSLLPG